MSDMDRDYELKKIAQALDDINSSLVAVLCAIVAMGVWSLSR